MKHNGKNIITDQDVTLTGNDFAGKTLDTVLTEQDERLDRIESNVKWIYKYGGVGSGSGGGSGSGSSTRWSAVVSRIDNGSVLKDGLPLNLSGPGSYGLSVKIYRGGSDTFTVRYSYQSSKGNVIASDTLNTNNSFNASRFLTLDVNGTLTIEISNRSEPDEPPITYTIPYIVSSYSFDLYYVYADTHEPFTNHSNNTIFMNDIKNRGIMAALDYAVAVNLQAASFTYTDWEGRTETIDDEIVGKSSKIIYIPLCSDISSYLADNNNAKFKQFTVDVNITLEGQTVKEDIPRLSLKDTLIPSDLFLRVTASGGTIYDSWQENIEPSNQYIVGTIVFQVTPFYGAITLGRTYNFCVYLDGVKLGEEEGIRVTTLSDQQMQSIPIPAPEAKEYKITFSVIEPRTQASYSVDYWFMTKEAISSFSYYPKRSSSSGSQEIPVAFSNVYRKLSTAQNIAGVTANTSFNITSVSDDPQTYNFTGYEEISSCETLDQMICLGIQYVKTNDTEKPIARFNIKDGPVNDVYIYQNKVVVNKDAQVTDVRNISGDSCEIYFPMCKKLSETNSEDYHLITIYKRLEKVESGNNYWKGVYVFIDGDLEAALGTFTTSHNRYESVTLFPGNYYINLIENSYFTHTENDTRHYYMDDIDIKGYYYAYKERILRGTISEETKQLYDNFSTFQITEDNYVMTNDTTITNIAEYSDVPVIVFNFTDNGQGANGIRQEYIGYIDVFKEFMSGSYPEETDFQKVPITVSYSPGRSKPETILKNGSPAVFSIEPQGSSTLGYRGKNWEVYSPSPSDENNVCVYSPNFKRSDTTTFLPETSFTLKADVVDSSHTNNNAIANFVNEVTTKFEGAKREQTSTTHEGTSDYAGYIKNCLSGFPVLVFLHTNFKDNKDQVELNVHNYYFLGIYNFNLGRKSYFNLGYMNTGVFERVELQEGFGIYEIPHTDASLLHGVMVGEIQGNDNYFDFSQYDQSILFKLDGYSDTGYMWGDLVGAEEANTKTAIGKFVNKVSRAGGYIFDSIGKEYFDDADHGYKEGYSQINHVPDYTWQATRSISESGFNYSYTQYPRAIPNDLIDFLITPEDDPEKHRGIDYKSLCEYYTICMAFGLVDSVEKNLNIKSWDAGREFYLAFYDMDTCLGVSNSGSKISYFAFSDYWDWRNSIEDNVLGQVKVYRDYAPQGEEGDSIGSDSYFDTPSSYLFAIAKYAYQVLRRTLTSNDLSSLIDHPNNLWATWRKRGGPLANAKSFIDKYYKHHLAGVPEVAFNYNYRYKYFVKSDNGHGFDVKNFQKFYGRKIAYTETWLDNRLHILDAYFNINNIAEEMNGYSAPTVTESNAVDRENPDIYVFHDIFSSDSTGLQYANAKAMINVKAKAYSPLICVTPNDSSRFMFSDNENKGYDFLFETSGNQNYLFGGSELWTEVETINPFIVYRGGAGATSGFSITSDYFTTITGTAGTCSAWSFNTPSLKSLSLTNKTDVPTYTGKITFEGLEDYPNLREVKIDGTAIDLKVTNSNIVSISALGMKAGAKITVENTPNIANIAVSGDLGDLSLPGWGTDIMIPGDGSTINSSTITVQNLKYPGASIRISNAPNLAKLVLTGFRKIVVDNCPRLSEIVLGAVEDIENFGLRVLDVTYPMLSENSSIILSDKLTVGPSGTAENTVDLSQWGSNFEALRLRHCPIEKVKVPDGCNVNLLPYAFWESRKLKWLDGDSTFWVHSSDRYWEDPGNQISGNGAETFHNAIRFTMKQEDGSQVDLRVHEYCTNLENTFCIDYNILGGNGDIHLEQAQYFLGPIGSEKAYNVNSVAYLFRGQHIEYNRELFLEEYNAGTCSIGFSRYPNCNKFSYAFRDTWVRCYNRYMFAGLGSEIGITGLLAGYSLSQVVYVTSNPAMETKLVNGRSVSDYVLYTTTDFLEEIIDRVYELNMTEMSDGGNRLCFLDPSTGLALDTLVVRDIFCPHGKTPTKLGYIRNMEFFKGHILDMTDAFRWGTTTKLVLARFMSTVDYQYFVDGSLEELFKYTNLYSAEYSFSNLYGYQGEVNMAEFISWGDVGNIFKLFYEPSGTYSLGFNKKVSYRDFQDKIWYNILRTPPQNMGCVFQDCTIYFESGQENEDFSLVSPAKEGTITPNTSITDISFLFSAMRAKVSGATSYSPLKMTSNFLKYLPNIKKAKAAFRGTYWANPIPWDFFNKRESIEGRNVYVKTQEDTFIPATLSGHEYRKELQDINECFAGIKLPSNIAWKADASYNRRYATWTIIGSDGNSYDSYYETPEGEEIIDWAWRDSQEVVECALPPETPWIPGGIGSVEWENPVITDSGKGLFISPDVFYACAPGCNVVGCFSANTYSSERNQPVFTGVIPNHLVWPLGKTSDLGNIMANLNILPRFYGSHAEDEILNKYYYFVPSGYTTRVSLDSAFNFKMILPKENRKIGTSTEKDYYYILLSDSLPKGIESMNSAFPGSNTVISQQWAWNGSYIVDPDNPDIKERPDGIYYSIMGTPMYSDDEFIGMSTGIPLEYYDALKADGLVQPSLAAIISGRIFAESYFAWTIRNNLNNSSNSAIYLSSSGLSYAAEVYLPVKNNQFMSSSSACFIHKESILNLGETVIEDGTSNKLRYYPNTSIIGM